MQYWKQEIDPKYGAIYSCDMLRINFKYGENIEKLYRWFEIKTAYDTNVEIKHTKSAKAFTFRDWFGISYSDGNSYILVCGFNSGTTISNKGFIEFNPNKLHKNIDFIETLDYLNQCTYKWEIVRYDLAIDIPIPREFVQMGKQGNSTYKTVRTDSYTESLGRHNNSGFTKVYDKSKESKLKEPMTRIEITLNKTDLAKDKLPKIYIKDQQLAFKATQDLSQNDRVFLRLLEDIPDPNFYLSQMTSRKRAKLTQYLSRQEFILNNTAAHEIRTYVLQCEKIKHIGV